MNGPLDPWLRQQVRSGDDGATVPDHGTGPNTARRAPPSTVPLPSARLPAMSAAPGAHERIYLLPGEWWFGRDLRSLSTLLGSCVAVTLWHPRWKVGGMCHYLVPKRKRPDDAPLDGRFGDEAMSLLFRSALQLGFPLQEYEVRMYGGAYMFSGDISKVMDVGARNVAHGRALLRRYQVAPLTVETGGDQHRNIDLDFASGVVQVRTGVRPATPTMETDR